MVLSSIPSPKKMWEKHEQLVLEVFMLALEMLREKVDLPIEEFAISEALALKTREVNFALNQKGRGLPFPPDWEKPKQPASETDLGQSKKAKRPDFSCLFRNHAAQNYSNAYLEYHIECKRLGKSSNSGWNFNENYVTKGICRFLSTTHRYGEGAFSGAMIGYVQNMVLISIIEQINSHILHQLGNEIPGIRFSEADFDEMGLIKSSQELTRKNVSPSSFELRHLWLDLRRKYQGQSAEPTGKNILSA